MTHRIKIKKYSARFVITALIAAFVLPASLAAEFNPAIRLDPHIDEFVGKVHALYGVLPHGAFLQPMGSADFLAYLNTLDSMHARNEIVLSRKTRYDMRLLRERLRIENQRGNITDPAAMRTSHNINSAIYGKSDEEENYGFIVNAEFTGDAWTRTGTSDIDLRGGGRLLFSPMLRGHIGNFSFYSGIDVWSEYVYDSLFVGSNFQPYNGIGYSVYGRRGSRDEGGNMRASDVPRVGAVYDANRIRVEGAIDYLRLGPAIHYPLTLSGYAPPITYFRTIFDFTNIQYYHIAGFLRSQRDKPKYIYANGLRGTALDNRLTWGINEVIITGSTTDQQIEGNERLGDINERSWEWAYMIPFVPLVFVEHYVGDLDNAALSFDFSLALLRGLRVYGEFFLDDIFTPWEIFSNDWGNKWAMTLGAQYFTQLANKDVSATIEWSRVEPWVYTHFYGGSHRYDHFDKPLGSPMGPNSQAVAFNCDMAFNRRVTAGVMLTSLQNNPTARGGNITDIFGEDDSETKKFLGDGTIHYLRPGAYGYFDPFGNVRLSASVEVDVLEDKGNVHLFFEGTIRF